MCFCLRSLNFYPRSPCGERRGGILKTISKRLISIHALLAESDPFTEHDVNSALISIHALLAESDFAGRLPSRRGIAISIHALLAESDRRTFRNQQRCSNFYPRSPCGERQRQLDAVTAAYMISIHALLAESDGVCNQKPPQARKFLSTLSLRRATGIITTFAIIAGHFYPRSPCGERPSPCVVMNVRRDFYPRSPCGERRCQRGPGVPDLDFYPRSPCGERLQRQIEFERYSDISIHALLAESDAYCINDVRCIVISIHALLAESDATLT